MTTKPDTTPHKPWETPAITLMVKLGSIVTHAQEMMTPQRHQFDVAAMQTLLEDEEVTRWLAEMHKYAMIPVKR